MCLPRPESGHCSPRPVFFSAGQFDSDGQLTQHANPWLWQLQSDLSMLEKSEGSAYFWQLFVEPGRNLNKLLLDDQIRAAFVEIRLDELRPMFFSTAGPPEQPDEQEERPEGEDADGLEGVFVAPKQAAPTGSTLSSSFECTCPKGTN